MRHVDYESEQAKKHERLPSMSQNAELAGPRQFERQSLAMDCDPGKIDASDNSRRCFST